MAKQAEAIKIVCSNKKARRDYHIEETIEAGIALWGNEVKSLRDSRANLTDAHVDFREGEAWLVGLHINPYKNTRIEVQDPDRSRKLLLHSREIYKLGRKVHERGYALIPLKIYFKRGYAKVELGLGKGKKLYDKRQDLKQRDVKREIERAIKRD